MTAIRAQEEPRTILDFSHEKCSKNKIKKALDNCYLTSLDEKEDDVTVYINQIQIGMYNVAILLPYDMTGPRKLKEFKDFEVCIYDSPDPKASRINLRKDSRFRSQDWVEQNFFGKLRVKHLVDIVYHCQRLDRLKAFL
jgi:hypothetical protein